MNSFIGYIPLETGAKLDPINAITEDKTFGIYNYTQTVINVDSRKKVVVFEQSNKKILASTQICVNLVSKYLIETNEKPKNLIFIYCVVTDKVNISRIYIQNKIAFFTPMSWREFETVMENQLIAFGV
jgi:hypothetical protein